MSVDLVGKQKIGHPLNSRQVERISTMHGGFFYQHLYGVACLLTVGRLDGSVVIIEQDEDLEILNGNERHYVQVKTRNHPLQPGDIAASIEQFSDIRAQHATGQRSGTPRLRIITNAPIGQMLRKASKRADWPSDIDLVVPGANVGQLPPAWENINKAFDWCVEQAEQVPFGNLAPESLVWKLAARVLHAGTSANDRTFPAEDVPALLEQLLVQLQDFPDPPLNYRPQVGEPVFVTNQPVRLVVGFSGAGKTAWASQAALHCPDSVAYIDVSDMPAASVASNVARELTARFLGGRAAGQGGALLADQTGLNVLRACAQRLAENGTVVQIIVDNAHRLEASTIRSLAELAPNLRFLCLGQPWDGLAKLETFFEIKAEQLEGWEPDDIAAEFQEAGLSVSVETALRVQKLTGGLPLYVRNAALVAKQDYEGNTDAFCDAIDARTNDKEIAQEIILTDTFASLDEDSLWVCATLSLSEVPLIRSELTTLIGPDSLQERPIAVALRRLRRASIVVGFQGDRLGLHDAARPLAVDSRSHFADAHWDQALVRLADLLIASLTQQRDVARLGFMMRLLPRIGRTEVLVELAGYEMFHEQGDPRSLRTELEIAANDTAKSASDRFWAYDALAYWDSRDGGRPSAEHLRVMAILVEEGKLGLREQMNLRFKEMIHWASELNRAELNTVYRAANRLPISAEQRRLLRYNYAVSLDRVGAVKDARNVADTLIAEYFNMIGITERSVIGKSNRALSQSLPRHVDHEDLKRLGDCLNLWSHLVVSMGEPPILRRITAMKFYTQAQAARSVVTTGLETVDDFLVLMADAVGAREILEQHVLPVVRESLLTDMVIPARSIYAIVLAWNGAHEAARHEMAALRKYAVNDTQLSMLADRNAFVERIIAGTVRLQKQVPPAGAMEQMFGGQRLEQRKVGRNQPCICGSGLKFKKCCGR
ncbi:MAG: SEC-C metal-binding domain-containing protein [Anderseniella sp.]